MPRIDAIDISHWQAKVDFRQVAQAGVIGVLHKCTEGSSYVDPTYRSRMQQARDAGLKWGAYHFLKHGASGIRAQMEHFLGASELPPGSRMAIDYEDAGCTLADLEAALENLSDLNPTAEICVYAGGLLKGQVGTKAYPWLSPYPLWLAQYTSGQPTWPTAIWPVWSLWQYTDAATVPGVDGPCDANVFNGSPEHCAKWFGPVDVPALELVPPEVEIAISVPDGVELRLTINGETVKIP